MRIDLGDQSFNTGVPDVNGAIHMVTGMEGWDSPTMRQSTAAPTGQHGTVLTESLLEQRSVVLAGVVKAPSESVFWLAYNGLLGLSNNLVFPKRLTVHESSPKFVEVIRGGQPRQAFIGVGSFSFEIPLLAVDPLKYTVTPKVVPVAAGATVTVQNDGNFITFARLRLTSSGTVKITNRTQASNATLFTRPDYALTIDSIIDMKRKTAQHSGGDNRYGHIDMAAVWWSLQPGANEIVNAGTAGIEMTYHDAWI